MLPLILKYSGAVTVVFFMASHLVKEKTSCKILSIKKKI